VAASVEMAQGVAGAAGRGELDRGQEVGLALAADGVEPRRAETRALEGGPGIARLDAVVLAAVADQDEAGAGAPRALQSGCGVAVAQEAGLVDDPERARLSRMWRTTRS